MKRVILRVDDICAHTNPADLSMIYGPCWERGFPVCFSVIPQSAYRFEPAGPVPAQPMDIRQNRELVDLLNERVRAGLVEVALHGWQHHYGEWASPDGLEGRVRRDVLQDLWPVRVAVPPFDDLSWAGYRALRRAGFGICSSWAATHGGTRPAHWIGRVRRRVGWPFAPAAPHRWPTDVDLLDFAGRDDDDWPITLRLLRLAERWRTPVVFVQHPWRTGAQVDRWRRWLDRIAALPDVRFERYSNG
jgi:hypothetical protein